MTLDFSRCRLAPFAHQREDVQALIDHPYFFIASEMRTGKTKIVIDAAQFLYEQNSIDTVIVLTPAPVRDVWADQTLGELAKHLWADVPAKVVEYHQKIRVWYNGPYTSRNPLTFYISNYEWTRSRAHLEELERVCGPKTMLVGDESSYLNNHAAAQTKAFMHLRHLCWRVVLMNGTPIFHDPEDLFSQGNILSPLILDCKYITHYRARYAIQEPVMERGKPMQRHGKVVQKVKTWVNLDDLERRFAPITVRRLQAECLDLPPKLDPVTLTATLTPETWKRYKAMRDELVIWLNESTVATSVTAAVKALRLSQITSGFVGGIEDANVEPVDEGLLESLDLDIEAAKQTARDDARNHPNLIGVLNSYVTTKEADDCLSSLEQHVAAPIVNGSPGVADDPRVRELGREKLDVLLWFIEQRLKADPNLHLVAWCRYRVEMFRVLEAVQQKFPQFECGSIQGGQKRAERLRALSLLKPETSPKGPTFVVGIEGTGSFGLDMCAAHTCVTLSSGYSPGRSLQTLDRVYGPNQKFPIAYFNVVAVGPRGQRTIDHDVIEARTTGEDVARRTSSAWVKKLS